MNDHPELRRFLSDDRPASGRDELLNHLRGCADCRAAVAAEDPSRLFALLALEPVPEGLLDRLSRGVAERIAEDTSRPARRSARLGWASIAASLLLAGAFSAYLLDRDGPTTEPAGASVILIAEERIEERSFELISSRGEGDWVDLSVGDARVVMIFDEELDL